MNIGWRTKYILALSEDFLIHRWKLSGTMGLAHGFHFHKKNSPSNDRLNRLLDGLLFMFNLLRRSISLLCAGIGVR